MTQTTMQHPLETLKGLLVVILILAAAIALRSLTTDSPQQAQGNVPTEPPASAFPNPLDADE